MRLLDHGVKISHPAKGLIPFEPYPFQEHVLNTFDESRLTIVNKARQLGISTLCCIYALDFALMNRNKHIMIIGQPFRVAQNALNRITLMLRNLNPSFMVDDIFTVTHDTKSTLRFANGSDIHAVPALITSMCSESPDLIIFEEAAFIKGFEEIWSGTRPVLATGGQAIVVSTPDRAQGQFYDMWCGAMVGDNDFKPVILPWYVHPERDSEWVKARTKTYSKSRFASEMLCEFRNEHQ